MNAMLRPLVPLLLASLAVAACGETNSEPSPSPTPNATSERVAQPTPTVEVLAPPADVDTSGWQLYRDEAHGFELKYPPDARLTRNASAGLGVKGNMPGVRIDLPKAPDTNLEEKYLFLRAADESPASCKPADPQTIQLVRSDGIDFSKEHVVAVAAMHGWEVDTYWVSDAVSCVEISTVLDSANLSAYANPPAQFDREAESQVFPSILSTFRWLGD